MEHLAIIDRVYVLNLASRPDRKKAWESPALRLPLLKERLELYSAVNGNTLKNDTQLRNGELGCSMSHAGIWKDALSNGYQYILVFEDDVLLDEQFELKLNHVLQEIQGNFDWVYLYNTWDYRPAEPFSDKLEKVIASLGTQAYLLNTKAISRLLPYVEEFNFPIDVVMGHMSFLSRVYRPKEIFIQHDENSASDIAGSKKKSGFLERVKKIFKH